jgi:hypothetical protein
MGASSSCSRGAGGGRADDREVPAGGALQGGPASATTSAVGVRPLSVDRARRRAGYRRNDSFLQKAAEQVCMVYCRENWQGVATNPKMAAAYKKVGEDASEAT